jgi:small-conductance mechanosensitive channel
MIEGAPEVGARLLVLRTAAVDPANLSQWGLIAIAILLGLLLGRLARAAKPRGSAQPEFPDLIGPSFALVAILVGWRLLLHHQPAPLLTLAVPLLIALCVVRLASHFLRTLLASRAALAYDWERQVSRLVWGTFALHLLGLLDPLMEMLDELALPIGNHSVSVLRVVQGGLLLLIALAGSLWMGRVLERRVMGVQSLDASLRVIFTKLLRGALLAAAVVFTLPLIGIDITFLSVLGGALGVGLGFGLQKIASNYVSGFIILLDRSVRLDDVLTVDNRRGVVSHMEARYTVLKAADGTETIIPNETFITSTVVNHTLNDRSAPLGFTLWLAHDADVHLAIAELEAMLRRRGEIMAAPGPSAQVNQVTDVGIELQVNWWVEDLARNDAAFRPAMLLAALDCLRAQGIALARRPDNRLPTL